MQSLRLLFATIVLASGISSYSLGAELPAAEEVDELAEPLIHSGSVVGMVVGLSLDGERLIRSYGSTAPEGEVIPDERTLFEIGSVTKTFTALLLAMAVERGELQLDDIVADYLPDDIDGLQRKEEAVRLVHLATHTSGLARMPSNFAPADPLNPYADYTVDQLYEYLRGVRLRRTPGEKYVYSNLAVGLLGHILAEQADMPYEALVVSRVCDPLELADTRIDLSGDLGERLAPGHTADGDPQPNWDLPTLAGAGALRSSVHDLLAYCDANLTPAATPFAEAIASTHVARHDIEEGGRIALGWHVETESDFLWHTGGTGGYRAFVAFCPSQQLAVVVLANTATDIVDKLGSELGKLLLEEPVEPIALRTPVTIDPAELDAYVGRYELTPLAVLDVRRDGDRLMAQLTGQGAYRLYPEATDEFFYRVVDAQITFQRDDDGQVVALVLHQNGQDHTAKKLPADD